MWLSQHFHLSEFIRSQTAARRGINNYPSAQHIDNLKDLCENVLEPIRISWGSPVHISSGYRSPMLNAAVRGSKTSQHCNGMAADIEIAGVDNCDLARWITDNIEFDQLILEFHNHANGPNDGWVHISFSSNGNRREILTAQRMPNGRTKYLAGLVA